MHPVEKRFERDVHGKSFFVVLLFMAVLFAWLAMSPCLKNDFANWDESSYIITNPRIKTLSWESVKMIFSTPDLKMYSPLSTFTYALDYHFAGLNPKIYHATSLFLHLADTALVMVLARLLFADVWLAFFTAILFGIHPAHVESVAWAAERKDVLYAFFYLSALISYVLRLKGAKTYFLSLALFVCALLSKPMAVTLPVALLLVDYLKSDKIKPKQWLDTVPFFVFSAVFAIVPVSTSSATVSLYWAKRLVVPFYNLGFYIYTLLWPFDLSAMYVIAPWNKPVYYVFPAGALAGIFLLWKYFRRDKEIMFGAAFFTVMLLPVLQIFPFGPVISADRYTYLSSIGIFIIGAVCARRLWRRLGPAYRGAMAICAISAVLVLAVTARVRCAVWKNGVSLWSDTFRKQPQAPSALGNLCGAYMQAGMDKETAACLSQAIRRYPETADNYFNLGLLYARNNDSAKAKGYFEQTLGMAPCHAAALNSIGNIYLAKGESSKALQYYRRAVQCDSSHAAAYLNLGDLSLLRKDKADAVLFYEKALAADPADEKTRALLKTLR